MNKQAAMLDFAEEESGVSLSDYINLLRRRKKIVALVFSAILVLTVIVAFMWPPTYQSEAIILIEEQQIPSNLVQTTITSYAQQRIEVIRQRIMTINNIMGIVEQFELYTERELKSKTRTEIANDFREAVTIEPISADVVDPQSGRPREAVIAFSLAFVGEVPSRVQKVANEITSLYLEENLKERSAQTKNTTSFLASEADALSATLSNLDQKIAVFKDNNEGALPELQGFNRGVVDRIETQLVDLSFQLKELRKSETQIEAELLIQSPTAPVVLPTGETVLGDGDRLKAMESEFRQKSAIYREDHPDLVRLKRSINDLLMEVGAADKFEDSAKQLQTERDRLEGLEAKYTVDHPEIIASKRIVKQLQESLSDAIKVDVAVNPDNPAYIFLKTRLNSVREDLRASEVKSLDLRSKLEKHEVYLSRSSQVEKEFRELLRELNSTQRKYDEIRAKQMTAELAQSLESKQKGERFTLIQPPELPREPISPNRPVIVILGLFLGLFGGIAVAILYETLDGAIYGVDAIISATGAPPLVSILYMETVVEADAHNKKRWYLLGALVVAGVFFVIFFHVYIKPLDVMWFILMRKLGLS